MNTQLQNFTTGCISQYAKYNAIDDLFNLDVSNLPDFIRHEFAAIIMADDNGWACEASGPDNQHWETKMLPALTRYLRNSTDNDEAIEFNKIWRDCVTDYMTNHMQVLIDNLLPELFS